MKLSTLVLAFVACAATPPILSAQNALTPEEQRAGWHLLFDGTSPAEWRGYQKGDMQGLRWVVQDGTYRVFAGTSSRDLTLSAPVRMVRVTSGP